MSVKCGNPVFPANDVLGGSMILSNGWASGDLHDGRGCTSGSAANITAEAIHWC